jgi:hypothetical protein
VRASQYLIVGFIFTALSICSPTVALPETSRDEIQVFPMTEGTWWKYDGTVRWTHDFNHVSAIKVAWKTEIRKLIRHEDLLIAVVNGFPTDLDWSDGHPKPCDSLVIRSGNGDYFLLASEGAAVNVKENEESSVSWNPKLSAENIYFWMPLADGKNFCDLEGMAREDGMYCWVVSSVGHISLRNVKGLSAEVHEEYEIHYLTYPDEISYKLVPGVGSVPPSRDSRGHGYKTRRISLSSSIVLPCALGTAFPAGLLTFSNPNSLTFDPLPSFHSARSA